MATTTLPRSTPTRPFSSELGEVLPGAFLVLLIVGAVIHSLANSNWAPGLDVLIPMSLPALLVGVIFARLRWLPGWLAHTLSALLAVVWMVHLLGDQMSDRLLTWRDQATELIIRGLIWGRVLAGGGRGEDILLFLAALCLLCWILAYGTAWMVFRHGWAWRAVLANAVLFLVNYTYVLPKPTAAFFVLLGAALLLLVYQNVLQRQAAWDAQQIDYPDLLPLRFVSTAAVVCGVLILITAFLPGQVSIDRATRTWETISQPFRLARERWEDAFSTITAPPGAGSGAFTARGAALGGARLLNNEPVMEVRSTAFDYWRAVAFDKYDDGAWQNTTGELARSILGAGTAEQARTPFDADVPIAVSDTRGRREVQQTFTMTADRLDDLIMVGGTPARISLPTLVEHNYREQNGARQPNFDDLALIAAAERMRAGTVYTVTALVSQADVASLRAAGTDYPEWVRERYLQLPDSVSARTRERALAIVSSAGASTPYDQAFAIQEALRVLTYNERIPNPPAGVDPVDWFLFEQREGYCDYFASSMVVMLRSLGVPARWVRGYAGGEFDIERGVYVVRENVAHSWPEVYFPGFGWERFEPTPASYTAVPLRPLTGALGADPSALDGPLGSFGDAPNPADFEELDPGLEEFVPNPGVGGAATPNPNAAERTFSIVAGIILLLALSAAALYGRWRYELRGLAGARRAYAAMEFLASWSGLGQDAHQTPREYAAQLAATLPTHHATITRIAAAYDSERYRPGRGSSLPATVDQNELYKDLIRHIFTSLGARLPAARERA
jgi:transglutaminase-like putative cysteine protease